MCTFTLFSDNLFRNSCIQGARYWGTQKARGVHARGKGEGVKLALLVFPYFYTARPKIHERLLRRLVRSVRCEIFHELSFVGRFSSVPR